MNILLVNHYAGAPEYGMEHRPYYLAREWVRSGHNVTIVAASFSHLRMQQPAVEKDWAEERIDGIRYVWLKTPSYEGNGFRRVLNMMAFVRQMRRRQSDVLGGLRPDAVVASSPHPLVIFPARRIARKYAAQLVFEVRDLWPLTLIELSGMSRWHPFIQCLQWTEDYAYRHADRVVSVLPKAAGYMEAHGMAPAKFVHVPNGMHLDQWRNAPAAMPDAHAAALAKLKGEGRFVVGYLGQHGLSNALDAFVEAAPSLAPAGIALVLIGQGPDKPRLEAKAARLRAANVLFLPPVPKASVPAVLAAMDALFLGWNRQPLYRYGISPNKLIDYMMAARPVIHAVDAGNDPVAESGCGIHLPPEDPAALAEAVLRIADLEAAQRQAMGERGRQYALAHYNYTVLAQHFVEAITLAPPANERAMSNPSRCSMGASP